MTTSSVQMIRELVLRAEGLGRGHTTRAGTVTGRKTINLEVFVGELVVVRGASGAAKSTPAATARWSRLPHLLCRLGSWGTPRGPRREGNRSAVPRRSGFRFQDSCLIPVLTAA